VAVEEAGEDQLDRSVKSEVIRTAKKERNVILQGGGRRRRKNVNWICHNLCRNSLLKHVIEGKVGGRKKVKGRRGRRSKHLLDDVRKCENTVN
jgi:hypothetical protein